MRATFRRASSLSIRPAVRPVSLPIAGFGRLPLVRGVSTYGGSSGSQSGSGARWSAMPLAAVAAVAGVYVLTERSKPALNDAKDAKPAAAAPAAGAVDYAAVRKAIVAILDKEGYDDGSLGPVFVRLAWHASGTYDKVSKTGGSNGATMRFKPESEDGANAGLAIAREALEPIKKQFPGISYADLWTLAASVAIEEMGGPKIDWRAGRTDAADGKSCPAVGRLPDASKLADHIRDVFGRMGFNDQEMVALAGAHSLGRCHKDRSGYVGPWTRAPTTFSNEYFRELLENKWEQKKWDGPKQYTDPTGELMMLPADLAFVQDPKFKPYVELYAKDQAKFFADFAAAWKKLIELNVPFGNAPAAAPAAAAAAPAAKKDEKKDEKKSLWQRIFG